MMDWHKPIFAQMLRYACDSALEREAGVENPYTLLTDKALVRVVIDSMAAASARKLNLGAAIVKQLGKKRK